MSFTLIKLNLAAVLCGFFFSIAPSALFARYMPPAHPAAFGAESTISNLLNGNARVAGVVTTIHTSPTPGSALAEVIGSAIAICWPGQAKNLWITAAHVVENDSRVFLRDVGESQVLFADHGMDLALLRSEHENARCQNIPSSIHSIPQALDPFLVRLIVRHTLHVEAYDVRQGRVVNAAYESRLATSVYSGLPGHDFTGPLLLAATIGLSGMSGGAILVSGINTLGDNMAYPGEDYRLYGMILASSISGNKVFALTAPVIYQRLRYHFHNPIPLPRIRFDGGSIIDETANYRMDQFFFLPTSARLAIDSGRSRAGDRGRSRAGDRGRSRGGDRDISAPGPRGVLSINGRRWAHLEDIWTEGAPLSPESRRRLIGLASPSGIHYDSQGLVRTSQAVSIPGLQTFSMRLEYFDFFHRQNHFNTRGPLPPCVVMMGTRSRASQATIKYVPVLLCEAATNNSNQQRFVIAVGKGADIGTPTIIFSAMAEFRGNRLIHSTAYATLPHDQMVQTNSLLIAPQDTWNSFDADYIRNLYQSAPSPRSPRNATSLRQFNFTDARVVFEMDGPLQIQFTQAGEQFEVVAPVLLDIMGSGANNGTTALGAERLVRNYLEQIQ